MLAPFTFIGVGGSGGASLRYLARELERRFEIAGWTDPMPGAFQFLHIDVPYVDDTPSANSAVPIDLTAEIKYLNLAAPPNSQYAPYDSTAADGHNTGPSYAKWRTNPRAGYPPVYQGAGQRRSVGRVLALAEYDRLKDGIEQSLRRTRYDDSRASLAKLTQALHEKDPKFAAQPSKDTNVMVFSSIAGGSGSGVVIDVLEILRAISNDFPELDTVGMTSTFLYTSEIFRDVSGTEFVHANSLGAMSEFVNAHEYEKALPDDVGRLLGVDGKFLNGSTHRIPPFNFVIGADNGQVTFQRQHEVYDSMAKGISALVADPASRTAYMAYAVTNVAANALSVDDKFTPLIAGSAARTQALGALGFATIGLGQKLFSDFAAESLASQALRRLLHGHKVLVDDTGRGDEAVLNDLAERLKDDFVDRCGLAELNGKDQVIDALLGTGKKDSLQERIRVAISALVDREIGSNPSGMEKLPKDWRANLETAFQSENASILENEAHRLNQRGPAWAESAQRAVVDATQVYIARYGLPLTLAVLGKVSGVLADSSSELRRQAGDMKSSSLGWTAKLDDAFGVAKLKEKLAGDSRPVKRSVQAFRAAVENFAQRDAHLKAADLLDLLRVDLLPRVIDDVDDARQLLVDQCSGQFQILVDSWSEEQTPAHLKATKNEELLIPQETYPEQFRQMVAAIEFSVGESAPTAPDEAAKPEVSGAKDAMAEAVTEVILGAWPVGGKPAGKGELIQIESAWKPLELVGNAGAGLTRPSHVVRFRDERQQVALSPKALLGQSERWVATRDGRVAEMANVSLGDWLAAGGKESEQSARGQQFIVALRSAIGKSAPLAAVNPEVYKAFYGKAALDPFVICGQIPMTKKHPQYAAVLKELDKVRPGQNNSDLINPKSPGDAVEILTLAARQIHPFAYHSVTRSIADDWESRTSVADARDFWQFRRARPLEEFVPLSSSRQEAFIRGWVIARILGLIEWDSKSKWSAGPMKVWTEKGEASFPSLLLSGDPRRDFGALPYVLESLPLAFLQFADQLSGSLDAYRAMVILGTPEDGVEMKLNSPPPALAQWIETGTVPGKNAPQPPVSVAGQATAAPDERRDAITAYLDRVSDVVRNTYADSEPPGIDNYAMGHHMWSIEELVLDVLQNLHALVDAGRSTDGEYGDL